MDGGTALGKDVLIDVATNPNEAILDPARPGSNATIDRAFYFTSARHRIYKAALPDTEISGKMLTHAGGPNPKLHQYVVAGTDAPFDFNEYTAGSSADARLRWAIKGSPGPLQNRFTTEEVIPMSKS